MAIVSPSFAAPGAFPAIHELAMERLRTALGLVPVEFPTTRRTHATSADRAADLMAAFGDPTIRAVMATIGGDDQITLLPHLDPAIVAADPKPFFGYSDNTNILNWLWNLGIVGFHGGSTMVHLGRGAGLHPVSIGSLRSALYHQRRGRADAGRGIQRGRGELGVPGAMTTSGPTQPSEGWAWHNADRTVAGPTWGGNLEILHWNLAAGRWIRPVDDYAGCILLIETSEEMPSATDVSRMLRNAGERGLLAQFPAIVVGRPKASSWMSPKTADERAHRSATSSETPCVRELDTYNPRAMAVFGVDIGHTDPQWVVPYGGQMRIDGSSRTIHVRY